MVEHSGEAFYRQFQLEIYKNQENFYSSILKRLPLNPKIFYPGAGSDGALNHYFPDALIVHLDHDTERKLPKNAIFANYDHLPIKPNVFDLLYINDSHANEEQFESLLKCLKTSGIVVYNALFSCGPHTIEDAFKNPRLKLSSSHSMQEPGPFVPYVFVKTQS